MFLNLSMSSLSASVISLCFPGFENKRRQTFPVLLEPEPWSLFKIRMLSILLIVVGEFPITLWKYSYCVLVNPVSSLFVAIFWIRINFFQLLFQCINYSFRKSIWPIHVQKTLELFACKLQCKRVSWTKSRKIKMNPNAAEERNIPSFEFVSLKLTHCGFVWVFHARYGLSQWGWFWTSSCN